MINLDTQGSLSFYMEIEPRILEISIADGGASTYGYYVAYK
ncbi:hypothetical protein [Clostridium kluyveri]|nr:hypothetical protein [Clostridium kluyveri]